MGISGKVINLSESDARKVLGIIRRRQDDCRKVSFDFPNYENVRQIHDQLEIIKLKITKQL